MFEAIIGDYAYLLAHYGSLKGPDRDYYVRRTSSSGSPKTTPVLPPSVPAKYNFRQARRQQEGIDRKLTTLQGKLIGRVRTRFFSRPRNNTMGMGEGNGSGSGGIVRRADLRGGSVRDPFGRGRSTGSDRFSFHPFLLYLFSPFFSRIIWIISNSFEYLIFDQRRN